MIKVTIRITGGLQNLETALDVPRERLRNLRPLMAAFGTILRHAARDRFAEGGYPPWKDLAASTVASKIARGLPARTKTGRVPRRLKQNGGFGPNNKLIATGEGRDSWVQLGAKGHRQTIIIEAGRGASIEEGSTIDYMQLHQSGTPPRNARDRVRSALKATTTTRKAPIMRKFRHPGHKPAAGMPARPVTLRERDEARLVEAAQNWLAGGDARTDQA